MFLAIWFCSSGWKNSLENSKTILYDFKNSGLVVLRKRAKFVQQKLGMTLGKGMKIKNSISSPPTKHEETFFVKNLCMTEQTFWGQMYRGMFYMGTNDQILQGGELMVKRFQRSSQLSFRLIEPDLGYWYYLKSWHHR